jgi:hypothetical protein
MWDPKTQPLVPHSHPDYVGFEVADPEAIAAVKRAEDAMWESLRRDVKLCRPGQPHLVEIG